MTAPERTRPDPSPPPTPFRRHPVVRTVTGLVVVVAAVVFVGNAITTSSARVNATTESSSFFAAGTVDLVQPDSAVHLLFDADGLFPGVVVDGCVEIEYRGTIPASVRLHADRFGGTGLEEFVELSILQSGDDCDEETSEGTVAYGGRLADLWRTHPSYADGIVLDPEMRAGERVVLRASATVADDNGAQGLTTDFAIIVEARP